MALLVVIAICGLSWFGTRAYEKYNLQQLKDEQITLHHNNELLRANNETMQAQIIANEWQIEANSKRWNEIQVELGK